MTIRINSCFDGGNIDVIQAKSANAIQLKIRQDAESEFFQWFYFAVSGVSGTPCKISIANAGQSSYPRGWEGFDVVSSIDHQSWFRMPTTFDGQTLSWEFEPTSDQQWFAYFTPYSLARHADFYC